MQRSKKAVYMIDQSDAWRFDIESAARDYQNGHKHRTWTDVQKECAIQTGPTRKNMSYYKNPTRKKYDKPNITFLFSSVINNASPIA